MGNCHQVAPNCSQDQRGPPTQTHSYHFIDLAVLVPTVYMTEAFRPHSFYYGLGRQLWLLLKLDCILLHTLFYNLFFLSTSKTVVIISCQFLEIFLHDFMALITIYFINQRVGLSGNSHDIIFNFRALKTRKQGNKQAKKQKGSNCHIKYPDNHAHLFLKELLGASLRAYLFFRSVQLY